MKILHSIHIDKYKYNYNYLQQESSVHVDVRWQANFLLKRWVPYQGRIDINNGFGEHVKYDRCGVHDMTIFMQLMKLQNTLQY